MRLALSAMPFRLCSLAQCDATTRLGTRCCVNAASTLRDSCGRLVAEPLLRGGRCCLLHMVFFITIAAPARDDDVLLFYLDSETSGLDSPVFRPDIRP